MNQELQDKVAIVTGAATMIGTTVARALLARGAKVVLADIAELYSGDLLQEYAGRVTTCRCDITCDEDLETLFQTARCLDGGLDILVNVASTFAEAAMETSRDDWLRGLNVNLVSPAVLVQKAAPWMVKRGGGAIIHFSSISGKIAQQGRVMYATSKAAVLHLTRVQAAALASRGIRVNCVSPGWTWSTPIAQLSGGERARADQVGALIHPLGRISDPEEVAQAVVFLASDQASFITGVDLPVDGGYSTLGPERYDLLARQMMPN